MFVSSECFGHQKGKKLRLDHPGLGRKRCTWKDGARRVSLQMEAQLHYENVEKGEASPWVHISSCGDQRGLFYPTEPLGV